MRSRPTDQSRVYCDVAVVLLIVSRIATAIACTFNPSHAAHRPTHSPTPFPQKTNRLPVLRITLAVPVV